MITKDIFSSSSLVANLQSVPDNIKKDIHMLCYSSVW